jgi:hypothetical protein
MLSTFFFGVVALSQMKLVHHPGGWPLVCLLSNNFNSLFELFVFIKDLLL